MGNLKTKGQPLCTCTASVFKVINWTVAATTKICAGWLKAGWRLAEGWLTAGWFQVVLKSAFRQPALKPDFSQPADIQVDLGGSNNYSHESCCRLNL